MVEPPVMASAAVAIDNKYLKYKTKYLRLKNN